MKSVNSGNYKYKKTEATSDVLEVASGITFTTVATTFTAKAIATLSK
jgi:hypothetical protein